MRLFLSFLLLVTFVSVVYAEQVGDMDGDGYIGVTEAIVALQVAAGGETPSLPDPTLSGLTFCNGNWADTQNDPDSCGNCARTCGAKSICNQGICISLGKKRLGATCTTDDECYLGLCEVPDGGDEKMCAKPTFRYIFLSSATYAGDLGGLSGADNKCNTLATNAGLSGTYKAWLSDSLTNAADRISHSPDPYVLTDVNTIVALNWEDLVDGGLAHDIDTDERGNYNIDDWVHTGTDTAGLAIGTSQCQDWNSTGEYGVVGRSIGSSPSLWTYAAHTGCYYYARLYCIQQ